MSSEEKNREIREAEAAVADAEEAVAELREKVASAGQEAIDSLAAELVAARARLDLWRMKLSAALDFQQHARERAEAEAHTQAVKNLRERKAALEAACAAWGKEKTARDARAREMRVELGELLEEKEAVEAANPALNAGLPPVDLGPVVGVMWAKIRFTPTALDGDELDI